MSASARFGVMGGPGGFVVMGAFGGGGQGIGAMGHGHGWGGGTGPMVGTGGGGGGGDWGAVEGPSRVPQPRQLSNPTPASRPHL